VSGERFESKDEGEYQAACSSASSSTYTGLVLEVDYTCSELGKHTLTLGVDSFVVTDQKEIATDPDAGSEGIEVVCQPGFFQTDHLICYSVKSLLNAEPASPNEANLADQFVNERVFIRPPASFCTRGEKDVQAGGTGTSAGVGDLFDAHLLCRRIEHLSGDVFGRARVDVKNQFGNFRVIVRKAQTLCSPAAKDGTAADAFTDVFKCYRAKLSLRTGSLPIRKLTLNDQFGAHHVDLLAVDAFCPIVEVTPKAPAGVGTTSQPSGIHTFVCIALESTTPVQPIVQAEDEWGAAKLKLFGPTRLCVPTAKPEPAP
jgi:hypothetical protein